MSLPEVARKDIVAKDGSSVYIEVRRAKFKDVGKTGNEETGLHEFHYKTTDGFEIKFQLGRNVDERLLRDVARTAIENWLGTPPVIDQASKVTGIMHGRWEILKKRDFARLLSPDQFLACIAAQIQKSEIALSETKLLADARQLLSDLLTRDSKAPTETVNKLRSMVDGLEHAITEARSDDVTAMASETDELIRGIQEAMHQIEKIKAVLTTATDLWKEVSEKLRNLGNTESFNQVCGDLNLLDIAMKQAQDELENFNQERAASALVGLNAAVARVRIDQALLSTFEVTAATLQTALRTVTPESPPFVRISKERLESALLDLKEHLERRGRTELESSVRNANSANETLTLNLALANQLARLLAKANELVAGGKNQASQLVTDAIKITEEALKGTDVKVAESCVPMLESAMKSFDEATAEMKLAESAMPRLSAMLFNEGSKSLLKDGRATRLILKNEGGQAHDLLLRLVIYGKSTAFGPYSIDSGKSIVVLVLEKAHLLNISGDFECRDQDGRRYTGNLDVGITSPGLSLQLTRMGNGP